MISTKWMLVASVAACNTIGDTLNAAGMKRQAEVDNMSPRALAAMVKPLVRNPLVLGGFVALAAAFFCLVQLLSIADVSFAVPATATGYALETCVAKYVLKEDVGARRWAAAILVAFGVMLLQW